MSDKNENKNMSESLSNEELSKVNGGWHAFRGDRVYPGDDLSAWIGRPPDPIAPDECDECDLPEPVVWGPSGPRPHGNIIKD